MLSSLVLFLSATSAAAAGSFRPESTTVVAVPNIFAAMLADHPNAPPTCDEDELQHPCNGEITVEDDEPYDCAESAKVKYAWMTFWICIKCDANQEYGKDLSTCPYFKCGNKALCGHIEAKGKEGDLTPAQMKCLYETRKPKQCGF